MNRKIIALILVLPMALMMTLFTAIKSVSLRVNISVSKIEFLGDDFVSLDLDKNQRYFIDYVVYPTSATNKNVVFSAEKVGNQELAELEFKNGYVYPMSAGVANVCITTSDGGFMDKFQVVVKAKQLKEINCSTPKDALIIGESIQIATEFVPYTATNKSLDYFSSNTDVATVSPTGLITACGKGETQITIRSEENQDIFDVIDVIVSVEDILNVGEKEINTYSETGSIRLTVDTLEEFSLSYCVSDQLGNTLNGVIEPLNAKNSFVKLDENGNFRFDYKFTDQNFYGQLVVEFTIKTDSRTLTKQCLITRVEGLTAEFKSNAPLLQVADTVIDWRNEINVFPSDAKVEYSVSYSNQNVSSLALSYLARTKALGSTIATITLKNKDNPTQQTELSKQILIYPEDVVIQESLKTYGIENIWTIGKTDIEGREIVHKLNLNYLDVKGENFADIENLISFNTDNQKVKVDSNGSIKILDSSVNSIVNISACINLNGEQKALASYAIRCVGNGVEVNNFISLHTAVKLNKVVVLQGNIKDDFGKDISGNNFYVDGNVDKIESTYDTKFYKNIGSSETKVITLMQFKNDVYGNGFEINANNVTNVSDADRLAQKALFNGPLNFVALGSSGSSIVSVKAQDNICFAVYENTKLNNVCLKGCDLQATESGYDLTDLDYVGTVVEVLGDNVNIEYSRISNGRTVIRAFGDEQDSSKVIHLNIKNSVLTGAREFVLRLGSNLFKEHFSTQINGYKSPYLDENDIFDFPAQQHYATKTQAEKKEYEQKYIKTFVNVENCVLKDSGIFCVGLDAHFSGPMLLDASQVFPKYKEFLVGWENIASTSYGVKLVFSGDVRIYDWKDIDNIDSSTLIDNKATEGSIFDSIRLDIKEMIGQLKDTSILYNENGKQYVHGGIAFFGGGKNYSVFENNSESFKGLLGEGYKVEFENYKISLKDVGKDFLEAAAGEHPFYFTVYGGNSRFSPVAQKEILQTNNAYDCIYFK